MQLPDKPFLIVAGGSVRVLAQWSRHLGGEIIAIDRFGDADTRAAAHWLAAPEKWENLPKLLSKLPAAPFLFCGGLDLRADVIAAIAREREVLGAEATSLNFLADWNGGIEAATFNRMPSGVPSDKTDSAQAFSKLDMIVLARECGLVIPETKIAAQIPRERGWLWKARRSCGGLGVLSPTAASRLDPRERALRGYWQQEIAGRAVGFSFLGGGSKGPTSFLGACGMWRTQRRIRHNSFSYCGSFGPIPEESQSFEPIRTFANRLARALDLTGWFGMDLIRGLDGTWALLEVNPRWCASMELLVRSPAEGAALLQAHCQACRDRMVIHPVAFASESSPRDTTFRIKKIIYAESPLTVPEIDWQQWEHLLQAKLSDLPQSGSTIPAGAPILSLLLQGMKRREVLNQLQTAVRWLRKTFSYYEKQSAGQST